MLIEALRLLEPFFDPSTVLTVAIIAALTFTWLGRWRLALAFQMVATAIVIALGILPGATWLALPLEERFQRNPPLPDHVAGIIALGGTERVGTSEAWGQAIVDDPTPIASLLALGRRFPEARLVFTGGATRADGGTLTEAEVVQAFLQQLGLSGSRLIYEDRARNTRENALFTGELVAPTPQDTWILVAQAISLPRAVGVFRHLGWHVTPIPAGYLTEGPPRAAISLHPAAGLRLAAIALHEWGGLLAYRVMGYIDELLPS